jgi:hypothetical protein
LIEYLIAQKNNYSCDTTSMRQANRHISHLVAKFILSCDETVVIFPGICLQHHVVSIRKEIFYISSISKDYVFLQALCPICADRSARFGRLISHSIDADVSIRLTDLGCHAALLPLIFIAFRFLSSTASYGRCKCVIELDEFESPNF